MKRDLQVLGVDENVAFDRRRWIKIIAIPTLTLGKIWTINENDNDDDDDG